MNSSEMVVAKDSVGSITHQWWLELKEKPGPCARLKRCGSILEVVLEPEMHQLRRRLQAITGKAVSVDKAALIAGVSAWVKESTGTPLGVELGHAASEKSAIEPRLRRLFREDWNSYEELLTQWRRMLALLNGRVNQNDLSELLFKWGDWSIKRLASDFYENFSSPTKKDKD